MNTYTMKTVCDNCREEQIVEIPYGTSFEDFIKDYKCRLCGLIQCKQSILLGYGYMGR